MASLLMTPVGVKPDDPEVGPTLVEGGEWPLSTYEEIVGLSADWLGAGDEPLKHGHIWNQVVLKEEKVILPPQLQDSLFIITRDLGRRPTRHVKDRGVALEQRLGVVGEERVGVGL